MRRDHRRGLTDALKEQRGVVLVLSLAVMLLLSVMAITLLVTALTEDTISSNSANHARAFYAAEAGLESGLVDLKVLLTGSATPTDAQLSAIAAPTLSDANYAFVTFEVTRTTPMPYQTVIASGPYQGLNALTTDYEITSRVTGPRESRANLGQIIQYQEIPLFQFGVFYGRGVDLEIAPGPPMTFNGRVHSNSNIYVVHDTTKFDSSLTTTGNIYRYLKRDPSTRGSNPQIKDSTGTYQDLNFDHEFDHNFDNPWGEADWKDAVLSTFDGLLQDSAMDIQEIIPPIPGLFHDPADPDVVSHQMIEKGGASDSAEMQEAKLYYEAGLRLEANDSGVLTATDTNGNPVDLSGCDADTVTTPTFNDKRELRDMTVTQVDIGKLVACGKAPANGILYVSHDGASPAVRVVNGAQLPSGGLTVVSENPMYVQGDYNTVNKQPAAIMADAITVLSNNWGPNNSDAKGSLKTHKRSATDTTVNAAFALGPGAESVPGQGNGQLENLIRFLEDWNGTTFTYNGSLISLWHSLQATADWRCCGSSGDNYYRPPNRNWGYDTLFDTSLPPGTPRGVLVTKQRWSQA